MSSRTRPKNLSPKTRKKEDDDYGETGKKWSSRSNSGTGRSVYWRHILLMLISWGLLINYYERSVVKRAMNNCQWGRWEDWPEQAEAHRVGLFADPQIMDAYSYPGRPRFVNYLTSLIVDHYHKRNWKFVHYYLKPDTTFFLGDLFDGGRYWEDDYWIEEYKRFNKIFPKRPFSKTVMSIPGNHDIGFGNDIIEKSLNRFKTYFGEPSSYLDVGNHTFVLLDTISLSDRVNPNVASAAKEFLDNFAQESHPLPRILLSHVPLYRDPQKQVCGDKRESKNPFPLQQGDQYQTVIDADLSQDVLAKVQPKILFSGDDHDYCHISHSYLSDGISKTAEEITVKSCAMNMGINRPAIQLLSLHNDPDSFTEKTYQTNICYMPDPFKPVKMYILMLILSAGWLGYMHFFPRSFNRSVASRMGKTSRAVDSSLPMPVSASHKLESDINSQYRVKEEISIISLMINAGISLVLVLLVFAYYYSSV